MGARTWRLGKGMLLTAWLIAHPVYTPTALREAAMMAASDVEWMVNRQRRQYAFTPEGTLLNEEQK